MADSPAPVGRLADLAALILAALEDGPKHGYAMTLEIGSRTGRRPGPGALYAAITRLVDQQCIAPVASVDRRRPYRLTPAGRAALQEHRDALRTAPNPLTLAEGV